VASRLLLVERAGRLQTSTIEHGNQWDYLLGWAPTEMIAIQGLRRYGYNKEADRITANSLSMIL